MEDNIEVKDVQRTEYLDKTGLDMLWTKIKENTHNQVEVERNRAVAKENSIVNSINNEFVSKTTTDDQTINSSLLINNNVLEIIGRLVDRSSAGLSLDSTARYLRITSSGIICNGGSNSSGDGLFFEANGRLSDIYHTSDQMIVRQFDSLNTEVSDQGVFVGNNTADGPRGIQITGNGIQIEEATQVPVNRSSDKVFATDGSIVNLTEYIKIASNITTGGFGAVRTVDTINNNIGVGDNRSQLAYIGKGELGVISYNNDGYATESFRYTTTYGFEMTNNRGYKSVKIPCDSNEVTVYKPGTNSYNTRYGYYGVTLGENHDDNNLLNTNGSYKTIGTDIVPLENGKVPEEYLDLSQYAKKSEITAGGNVNDVQINGVSVVENKVANIKPATKEKLGVVKVGDGLNVTDGTISVDTTAISCGNYIPYESIENNMYTTKRNKGILFKSGSGNISIHDGQIDVVNVDYKVNILSHSILLQSITNNGTVNTLEFELSKDGLRLRNGDNNHVLTSYGSTIDITQYVLKSVYDEKIAALEARIAALEAKHVEV